MFKSWHVALLLLSGPGVALADEDTDLSFIPKQVQDEQPAPKASVPADRHDAAARRLQGKAYVEDAFTAGSSPQRVVVPFPPPSPYLEWQNRTSLDVTGHWSALPHVTLSLSDRFNVLEESDFVFPSSGTLRNDPREVYATWEPFPRVYLEAGRLNVRNGVALGFNPTDFFKTGSLVGQASQDPSVLRENRLGTLMARSEIIWTGGSSFVALAPKVDSAPALSSAAEPGLDPRFAFTNSVYRMLTGLNFELAGLSPQLLGYFEHGVSRVGTNISRAIGDSVVAYAEWAGGSEPDLITRAVAYGKQTGTLPAASPTVPATDTSSGWRNDAAVGASWTSPSRLTLNLEYHFHQGGFSKGDWNQWFNLGSVPRSSLPGELWYIRGYANTEQEPVSTHQIFARADWVDAFVSHLELTGFAFVSLLDGSAFGQVSAVYSWSDWWTMGAYFSLSVGDPRSEHGSVPQVATGTIQVVRYL